MPRGSSLFPREHGAYAQLGFPLATGLIAANAGLVSVALAISAASWFLLYEPAEVLTGRRGQRLLDGFAQQAWRRGMILTAAGIVSGVVALALAPPVGRVAALVPVGLASLMVLVVARGRQKTLAGELLAVAAFSAAVLPMSVSAGRTWQYAWIAMGTWCASFALGTMVVHAIKVRHKQLERGRWTLWGTPSLAMVVGGASVGVTYCERGNPGHVLAVVPAVIAVLLVHALRVHPRRLRRVGWGMVVANLVTLVMLVG